ncbi:MAG: hypothetical protein AAGG59_08205 [Bacteroidota bacterium]
MSAGLAPVSVILVSVVQFEFVGSSKVKQRCVKFAGSAAGNHGVAPNVDQRYKVNSSMKIDNAIAEMKEVG